MIDTKRESARKILYRAAISCGHSITSDLIKLHRNPGVSNDNALAQLADRLLVAHLSIVSATEALGQAEKPLLAGQSPAMDREPAPAFEAMRNSGDPDLDPLMQPPAPEPVIDAVKVSEQYEALRKAYVCLQSQNDDLKERIEAINEELASARSKLDNAPLPPHPAAPQQAMSDEKIFNLAVQSGLAHNYGGYGTYVCQNDRWSRIEDQLKTFATLLQKAGASGRDAKPIVEAATALANKLDEVHRSPEYQSVFVLTANRGMPYRGPNYGKELSDLFAALSPPPSTDAKEAG